MIRTIEAVIDKLGGEHRALIVILDAEPAYLAILASEHSLSEWHLPEEEHAWMHLQ